jgi:hypothetical protein
LTAFAGYYLHHILMVLPMMVMHVFGNESAQHGINAAHHLKNKRAFF